MGERIYMLGFIFSKMLNPLSYTVFLVFFLTIYLMFMKALPVVESVALINAATIVYTPLLFMRLLLFFVAVAFIGYIIFNVIVIGKFIIKRMTLSTILALCIGHILISFATIVLPIKLSIQHQQHALHQLFNETPIEMLTTILLGMLLALYVGVLSKEKFKKDIGFIDDRL